MKSPLILLILLCLGLNALAQTQSPCEEAATIIEKAEQYLKAREYQEAISRLLDAGDICPEKAAQVNALIEKAFQQIKGEREAAKKAERSAQQAKKQAEAAQKEALNEKQRADSSLSVANRVLDQMYFYQKKYGLTLKDVMEDVYYAPPKYRYGYIDRQGNEVIPFEFEEATPFSNKDGFARVQKEGQKYLLDTAGVIYRLAESLAELDEQTEALDLHEQLPDSLPTDIGHYQALKILLLYEGGGGRGPIQSLPASFGQLAHLQHLDLRSNQLNSLPESFGQLSQLQRLYLRDNPWIEFPKEVENLSQVKSLDFSKQGWEALPKGLENFVHLESLDLSANQLSSLPESFGQLSQLQRLYLYNNGLSSLPDSFGQLSQLQSLYLHNNELSSLPEEVCDLENLSIESQDYFVFEQNPLLQVPDCWLEKHSEEELVEFATLSLSESLYHVSWQTLGYLKRRFPERFWQESWNFANVVAWLEGIENEDLERIRAMLEE